MPDRADDGHGGGGVPGAPLSQADASRNNNHGNDNDNTNTTNDNYNDKS